MKQGWFYGIFAFRKIINKHTTAVLLLLACHFYQSIFFYGLFRYYQESMVGI